MRENGERRPEEPSDNKMGLNLVKERMKKRILHGLQSSHKRVQQGQWESLRQCQSSEESQMSQRLVFLSIPAALHHWLREGGEKEGFHLR